MKRFIKNGSKNATLPFKKTSDHIITLSKSSKTANNRKLFENASSPVFAFFSKIIRFYFIGVFPNFLDTCIQGVIESYTDILTTNY
jgi:hypothetical protein